jgi:hypothetical protein
VVTREREITREISEHHLRPPKHSQLATEIAVFHAVAVQHSVERVVSVIPGLQ